jgi:hypothetical protein
MKRTILASALLVMLSSTAFNVHADFLREETKWLSPDQISPIPEERDKLAKVVSDRLEWIGQQIDAACNDDPNSPTSYKCGRAFWNYKLKDRAQDWNWLWEAKRLNRFYRKVTGNNHHRRYHISEAFATNQHNGSNYPSSSVEKEAYGDW